MEVKMMETTVSFNLKRELKQKNKKIEGIRDLKLNG